MLPAEQTIRAMSTIISIHVFDRLWIVFLVLAIVVFLLPFSVIIADIFTINLELLKLRVRKAFKETVQTEDLSYFCYKHTARNALAVQSIMRSVGHYLPPWWYSPHLGTLVAFGFDPQLEYETEIIKSSFDGDCFQLSWFPKKPKGASVVGDAFSGAHSEFTANEITNVLIFFPGLGLSSRSKVSQQVAQVAAESNFVTVVVGARGLETPLETDRPWHPGFYLDAVTTVEYITNLYGKDRVRIFLLGYSAGSNIVHKTVLHFERLKKISQPHITAEIAAATCVCVNYDYLNARTKLENSYIGMIYSMLMCAMCKEILQKNAHIFDNFHRSSEQEEGKDKVLIPQQLTKCLLLSHYDEYLGLTIHGYPSSSDLQESLSMFNFQEITIPLLAIQPRDDPLHMGEVRNNINLEKVIENSNIIYLETKYGNHFGFYEGSITEAFSNKTSYTYPPRVAMKFFQSVVR